MLYYQGKLHLLSVKLNSNATIECINLATKEIILEKDFIDMSTLREGDIL